MNKLTQNEIESLQDLIQREEITADQANVEMVLAARFRIITNSIPRKTRKALNEAVKNGVLGHVEKDGLKPEVYYHPNFDYLARAERTQIEKETINTLCRVLARPGE